MHSDVHFFSNVVLHKAISDKQFCYLVLSILQSIISYRIQFSFILNAIIRKSLKFKAHLPHNFLITVLLHFSFYGIKTFIQVQSESKSSSIINFANAPDYRSVLGIIFSFCGLSFFTLLTAFCCSIGMPISKVLSDSIFFRVACSLMHYGIAFKWLDLCGSVLVWFDSAIHFLGARLLAANVKPYMSVVCLVYSVVASAINSFVKQFGSCFVIAGAAAFFSKFGLSGVMSSTLVELKVIALTLACLSSGSSVFIHFDSQAALSAFNFIRRKSLAMAWLKVKDYSGILGNEHANEISYSHLLVVACKHVYCIAYPSVKYLFCNKIDTSEHSFVCFSDMLAHNKILSGFCARWSSLSNVIDLSFSVSNAGFYSMLAKGFVLNGWYCEALDVLGCSVVADAMVIDFVRDLASSHRFVI
ncbi:hypothetical protein G9A89_017992 [Geosiphon pyriformis]|nr:hypothetical protein G9A89_017992 [Geosiphon pyriformis]